MDVIKKGTCIYFFHTKASVPNNERIPAKIYLFPGHTFDTTHEIYIRTSNHPQKIARNPASPDRQNKGDLDRTPAFSRPSYSSRRTINSFIAHAE